MSVYAVNGVPPKKGITRTGVPAYTYSTGGAFSGTAPSGSGCSSSSIAIALTPNPKTTNNTPVVNTSGSGTVLTLWSPNPQTTTGGTVTSTFSAGGTASTVADVALYYYQMKLGGGQQGSASATAGQGGR